MPYISKEVMSNIEQHNYAQVTVAMEKLKHNINDPVSKSLYQDIQRYVINAISALIDETKSKIILSGSLETLQKHMNEIINNIKKIKAAQRYLQIYFENPESELGVKDVEPIKKIIAEKMDRCIASVHASIDSTEFEEADKQLSILKDICDLLGEYCSSEINERIESLGKKISNAFKETVEQYC